MRGPSAAAVAEGSVCATELAKDTDAPARRGPIARQSRAPVAAGVAARLSADWVMENDTASLSSLLCPNHSPNRGGIRGDKVE